MYLQYIKSGTPHTFLQIVLLFEKYGLKPQGIPNLFTMSYHLGTPYFHCVPFLPEQLN